MNKKSYLVIRFILKIIQNKSALFFWLFVRFLSATLPLITIFLFSHLINLLETTQPLSTILTFLFFLFLNRLIDNYLRIKSTTRLEEIISNISFDIDTYFLSDLKAESKLERHETVQAVRNFSDSASVALNIFKQPGVDSFVSLLFIPAILFFVDFQVFIIEIAYISIYYFIDYYTTQKYLKYKDIQNTKTEVYFAKLQDSNDFDLEQKTFSRHFGRLSRWNFTEWFTLQNSAVFFYSLILFYMVVSASGGQKSISDIVLIMGYIGQTQTYLNAMSDIVTSLTDARVSLEHLAKNKYIPSVNLSDLV